MFVYEQHTDMSYRSTDMLYLREGLQKQLQQHRGLDLSCLKEHVQIAVQEVGKIGSRLAEILTIRTKEA